MCSAVHEENEAPRAPRAMLARADRKGQPEISAHKVPKAPKAQQVRWDRRAKQALRGLPAPKEQEACKGIAA